MLSFAKIFFLIFLYSISLSSIGSSYGLTDNVDPLSGYFRVNQKYLKIPGPNGMNINLVHSYTDSSQLTGDLSTGNGWNLSKMQIIFNTEYKKKKKKSTLSYFAFWKKHKKRSYGFEPKSANLLLPNGQIKHFTITKFRGNNYHHNGFHYTAWPEELKSNDHWLIVNPEYSHEMYLYDPNGVKYTFSVDISNSSFNQSSNLIKTEDLHGNWIQYNYTEIAPKKFPKLKKHYLTSITTNDNREVNFSYTELHVGNRAPHFIVLDEMKVQNRIWNFKYKTLKLKHSLTKTPVLDEVIFPDKNSRKFFYEQSTDKSRLLTKIKSPNGLITKYDYKIYKKDKKYFGQLSAKSLFDPSNNLLGSEHYHIDKEKVACDQDNHQISCIKNYIENDKGKKEYTFYKDKLLKKVIVDYQLDKIIQTTKYKYDFTNYLLLKKSILRDSTLYTSIYLNYDNLRRPRKVIEDGPSGIREKFYEYTDKIDSNIFNLLSYYKVGESFKSFKYDYKGKLIEKSINNIKSSYNYHLNGDLASMTEGQKNITRYDNYFRGKPQKITFADGATEYKFYDNFGLLLKDINANGFATEFEYDILGRKIKTTPPKGISENIFYNLNSLVIQRGGFKKIKEYDCQNKLVSISQFDTGYLFSKKDFKYDFFGRKTFESRKYNHDYGDNTNGIYKSYDALNRLKVVDKKSGEEHLISEYNYLPKNGLEVINPKGHKNIFYYQSYGFPSYKKVVKTISPSGIHTDITRSKDGLIEEIKREKIGRYFYYNQNRLLKRYVDPETIGLNYDYNDNGKLIEIRNDNRESTIMYYDARSRLTERIFTHSSNYDVFKYDQVGNLVRAVKDDTEWQYEHDENNNIIEANLSIKKYKPINYNFKYGYNDHNHLSNITYPSKNKISYHPNSLGLPRQVGGTLNNIVYYPNNKIKSFSYGNGVVYFCDLNNRGKIKSVSYQENSTRQREYEYDDLNNITRINNDTFTFDEENRLKKHSNAEFSRRFSYDIYDNVTLDVSEKFQSFVYGANNRLKYINSNNNIIEFEYDSQGRVIGDGVHKYSYNPKNQLESIDGLIYLYDSIGNLYSKGDNYYIHDFTGNNLLEVYSNNTYKENYYLNNMKVGSLETKDNKKTVNYFDLKNIKNLEPYDRLLIPNIITSPESLVRFNRYNKA